MFRLLLYFILKEDAIRNENVVVYNTKIKNNRFTSLASCLGASCWGLLAALEASALLCCFCTFLENNASYEEPLEQCRGELVTCMRSNRVRNRIPCCFLALAAHILKSVLLPGKGARHYYFLTL